LRIVVDNLQGPEIIALLQEHLAEMRSVSPPESVHALDLSGLRKPDVTFWTLWLGSELAGCGALKGLSPDHGEIKSMRTAHRHKRQGIAANIVRLTDNGLLVYSKRYVIDLGSVDLAKQGTYEYKLSGMPNATFNVSIRIFEGTRNSWGVRPEYPATVRMQMRNAAGESVIDEAGSLNSWVRSYGVLDDISDLYRMGEGRDIPLPGGGTKGERLGLKASGGWGTYFDSNCDETYTLRLEVLPSEHWTRPARVVAVGW